MDALSNVMEVLRFSGGMFLEATFRAPWCIDSQVNAADCAPEVPQASQLIALHYVLDGECLIRIADAPPRCCTAGDLVVIARNDVHRLGSDLALAPVPSASLIRRASALDLACIDVGAGESVLCRAFCGYVACATRANPLLESLPAMLVANIRARPCAQWIESSFRFAAQAHAARSAGTQHTLARLAELMFIEALRDYVERLPPASTGWLAALADPPLARALAAVHAHIDENWTAERLADEAMLSRSAFAERFVRVLGVPPMTYVIRWRMLVAAQRLRDTHDSIERIAAAVGYQSEATFSRAFSREMGVAPGAFRRAGRPARAA